jgi:hypothetical protein
LRDVAEQFLRGGAEPVAQQQSLAVSIFSPRVEF